MRRGVLNRALARRWRGGVPSRRQQRRWRPRYAGLFALVGLQYADSKLDFLPPAADAACTVLAVGIGLLFLGERVLDSETTKLGA